MSGVIAVCFLAAACFWSGFEQAGSSMNLFADRLTDRVIAGWEMPASWLQSVNGVFIILLAPLFSALWIWLGSRNPSIPAKMGFGLIFLGVGFAVLAWGSVNAAPDNPVSPELARRDLFLPHSRRAVPQPDRPQQHHATVAARATLGR